MRSALPSMRRSVRASASDDSAATITARPVASHTTRTAREVVCVESRAGGGDVGLVILDQAANRRVEGVDNRLQLGLEHLMKRVGQRAGSPVLDEPVGRVAARLLLLVESVEQLELLRRPAAAQRVASSDREASSASRSSCRYRCSPVNRNARVLRETRSRRLRSRSASPRSRAARSSASSDLRTTPRMTTAAVVTAPIATRASRKRAIGARSHAMVCSSLTSSFAKDSRFLRHPGWRVLSGVACRMRRFARTSCAHESCASCRRASPPVRLRWARRVQGATVTNEGEEQVRKERSNEDSSA